jgi:hypothetical protein
VRSERTSRSASSAVSGSSATDDMLRPPPPQLGCVAVRSGRDGQTNRAGPATRSASSSSRSSSTGSAQWMSSITTTIGSATASAVKNERQASWSSSRISRGDAFANDTSGSSRPTV